MLLSVISITGILNRKAHSVLVSTLRWIRTPVHISYCGPSGDWRQVTVQHRVQLNPLATSALLFNPTASALCNEHLPWRLFFCPKVEIT